MREESVNDLSDIVVLLVWSLFLFLAFISIINLLHITYYPIYHRANIESTIHIVLISDQFDSALFIIFATLSSFFTFLALQRFNDNKWLVISPLIVLNITVTLSIFGVMDLALVLVAIGVSFYSILAAKLLKQIISIINALLSILCFFEAGSLIHWLLLPFPISFRFEDMFSRFANIEAQLFYMSADLTPVAMLVLLFSYPLYTIINWLMRRTVEPQIDDTALRQFDLHIDGHILLVVAVFLTAFIASYPYLPSINPTGKSAGTDIYYYSQWLNEMEANASRATEFAIHHISSRPLFLLLLYYLKYLVQMPTITFLEWIAVPIFCLLPISVYCFGKVVNGRSFAGLVALLSSFSINVVAGMYTAYYSNILALSILYFALAFLILALRKTSYLFTLLSCILSIITIFIHPWTWAFILVALILFVGIKVFYFCIISHGGALKVLYRLWPILVFLAANIIADQLNALLLAVPSGVGISYDIASGKIGLNEFLRLGFNLNFTFKFFAGGYFNNLSAIILAIVGTWWLIRRKELSGDIILTWLSLGAIPTPFVDFWVNERIFYNLPIQVLSSVGLWYLSSSLTKKKKFLQRILLLVFILLNLNYALRSMANLV